MTLDARKKTMLILSGNIKKLRAERSWTYEDLSDACELSIMVLKDLEAGKENTTLQTIFKLGRAFSLQDPLDLLQRTL